MNDEPSQRDRAEIVLKTLVWAGFARNGLKQWRAGLSWAAIRGKLGVSRWLVFLTCLALLGTANLSVDVKDAQRFRGTENVSWSAANDWVLSAQCARQTGAWLVTCREGRLYPNHTDDLGHAFFLGMYSRLADKEVTLVDVVRLNAWLAFVGFALLGALLFAMRSYTTWLVLLLVGGPIVFWAVPRDPRYVSLLAPHASLVGVAAMAALLPISIVAYVRGWLPKLSGLFFIFLGLLLLATAALVREVIGMMGLLVSLCVLMATGWMARRNSRLRVGLAGLGLLMVIVWMTPRWVLLVRDICFSVEPATQLQAHGISHTLYIGLGAVDNRFGIEWLDSSASDAVKAVAPQVPYVSPEYFRILWSLYFAKVREDPAEVMRIYLTKARILLGGDVSDYLGVRGIWPKPWTPSLGLVLAGAIVLLALSAIRGLWRRYQFEQELFMGVIAFVFAALFVVQGVLARHTLEYAAPIGLFVLLLAGVALELFCRWQLIRPAK